MVKELLNTIFARATRLFKPVETVAGGYEGVINEQSKTCVYLEKKRVPTSVVYSVDALMNWFKGYEIEPTIAYIDMVDLINGDVAYSHLATMNVLASNDYDEERESRLIFRVSKELDDWRMKFSQRFTPQNFRQFLQNRREEYNDDECHLFESICNLNMSVSREYELEDDGGVDRKIHFQVKKGADFTHLPRMFYLEIPMLFGDDSQFRIPVELKFELPHEDNGNRPYFVMTCEFLDRLMIERVKACVEKFEEDAGIKTILGNGGTMDVTPQYKKVIGA